MLPSDVIRRHGWLQGKLGGSGGPRCALGAICEAEGLQGNLDDYYEAMRDRVGDIPDWNDMVAQTVEEVLEVMDAVEVELGLKVPVPLFTRELVPA
jgi:hypothetical protein